MKCRSCGENLSEDIAFCPYCGAKQTRYACSGTDSYEEERQRKRYCTRCGGVIDKKTKRCTRCGRKASSFGRIIVLLILLIILTIFACFYVLLEGTSNSTASTIEREPFEQLSYSGSGPGCITGINIPAGTYNIIFTHDGNHNFIVHGGNPDVWVNEIGPISYVCQITVSPLEEIRDGYLNITSADGNWTVTINEIK